MGKDTQGGNESWVTKATTIGKDLVSLLRDGSLFLLAFLLLVFPTQFNSILVEAGFEEGSLVGFKWRSKLVDSNEALEEAQVTIANLQSKNDELVKALTDANSELNDPIFMERTSRLEDENQKVKDATSKVQTTVQQTIDSNSALVEKALSSTRRITPYSKSDYFVGLQTVGIPDTERVGFNEQLRSEGYGLDSITWSYPAGERPSWFAYNPTVFYYSTSARAMAEQLARFMKTMTGENFAVQRGAGLGVDPERKDLTLFVHYIKK